LNISWSINVKNWVRVSLPPSGDSPVTQPASQGPTIIHGVFELSLTVFQGDGKIAACLDTGRWPYWKPFVSDADL